MGRELKRVAMDFDWPLNEPWEGYLNPYYSKVRECEGCEGRGEHPFRAGVDCPYCDGTGEIWKSPDDKRAAEEWQEQEPPSGPGFQIWETVSEGSPISPVFATTEELARYMAGRPWGADRGSSYEAWLSFINGPRWSVSMVLTQGSLVCGPEAGSK